MKKKVGIKTESPKRLTPAWLRKIGSKEVVIPGLLLAAILGWKGWDKLGPDIYKNKTIFPGTGIVRMVFDGDTFELQSGVRVRLIDINAFDKGNDKFEEAKKKLRELVEDKKIYLEYDRYQDDGHGRVLAWVWLGCETMPKFNNPDYMRLTFNRSREGLVDNPSGCEDGVLVQEEMIKNKMAKLEVYKDRGELKYEERLEKY